jgi:tape measure domain-containing protein
LSKVGDAYLDIHGDFSPIRRQAAIESRMLGTTLSRSVPAQMQRNLQGIAAAGRAAVLGVGGLSAYAAGRGLQEGLRFNATMESNELALERFTGGTRQARKYLDELYETAKRTPFEFADLTTASRRLMSFGLDADRTQRVLSATGDAIAAMGGGAEHIDRVTMALGQMQAKGRVSAEELLQLTEAGIPAYQILQEELDLTSEQVRNIGNEGIKADDAIAALTRGMEERFKGAAREQAKTAEGQISTLRDNVDQMLGAVTEGIFEAGRDEWLPAANEVAGDLAKVWNREDITPEEKFARSRDVIDREFGPLVDELWDKVGDADLDDKLVEVVNDAIPVMAEALAEGAGDLVGALGKGFMESDEWGKLAIGTFILRKLGLAPAAMELAGLGAARAWMGGYTRGVPGSAGPIVAGGGVRGGQGRTQQWIETPYGPIQNPVGGRGVGTLSGLGRFAAGAGRFAGGASAFSGLIGLSASTDFGFDGRVQNALSSASFGLIPGRDEQAAETYDATLSSITEKLEAFASESGATGKSVGKLSEEVEGQILAMEALGDISPKAADELREFAAEGIDASRDLRSRILGINESVHQLKVGFHGNLRSIRRDSEDNMAEIESAMDIHSDRGRRAVRRNMDATVKAIERAMEDGKIGTKRGMEAIDDLIRENLARYDITGSDAEKILKAQETDVRGKDRASFVPLAGGGILRVPGQGLEDTVPLYADGGIRAMVAPGEKLMVANRHQEPLLDDAVRARWGVRDMEDFFARFNKPHYMAGGGIVPVPGFPGEQAAASILDEIKWVTSRWPGLVLTDAYGQGHSSPGHTVYGTAADFSGPDSQMDAAVRALVQAGYLVGYDGRFGSEAWSGHGPSWVTSNFHFHVEFGEGGGALVGKGPMGERIKIKLPRFASKYPAFTPHAAGLNRTARGLEREMGERLSAAVSHHAGMESLATSGKWQNALRQIAEAKGWDAGDWMTLVMKESSGDPTAVNPSSGAFGLGQFLGSTLEAYAKYGSKSTNPVRQIQAMAQYIDDRYGNPSNALAFHNANNWYSVGGLIEKLAAQAPPYVGSFGSEGVVPGPIGAPRLVEAHGGEEIRWPRRPKVSVTVVAKGSVEIEDVYTAIDDEQAEVESFRVQRERMGTRA